eukprot:gene23034-1400_t
MSERSANGGCVSWADHRLRFVSPFIMEFDIYIDPFLISKPVMSIFININSTSTMQGESYKTASYPVVTPILITNSSFINGPALSGGSSFIKFE